MALLKKIQVFSFVFFLFVFSISTKLYAQDIEYIQNMSDTPDIPDIPVEDVRVTYPDTVILSTSFLPIIFDGSHRNWAHSLMPELLLAKPLFPPLCFSAHRLFADINRKNSFDKNVYDSIIVNQTSLVKYTKADFEGKKVEPLEEIESTVLQNLFRIDYDFDQEKVNKPERFRPKRRYWIYNGSHSLQLSQTYFSENWYNKKGGAKYLNLLSIQGFSFNYAKNKFRSNNSVEWKLSLNDNPNDTLRNIRIMEDRIRTYSDFGFQAIDNWSYSANVEITTQVFKNYKENTRQTVSSLFSPIRINVGLLGMKYNLAKSYPKVKGKNLNFSADISPLSIQYLYVSSKEVDQKQFGVPEADRHLTDFGSSVKAVLTVNFNKNVNFISRFLYFTNYEKITAESENTLNMPINRYFSTRLYLYLRYDDNKNLARDPKLKAFQMQEAITFGFNYRW